MSAQNIISHRMFVAALSHDPAVRGESAQPRRLRSEPAAAARGSRARPGAAASPPGAVAQQLLLLSEVVEFQPVQT